MQGGTFSRFGILEIFGGGDGVGICGFGDKASTPVQSVEMDGCRVDCETLAALRRDGTKNAMAVTVKQ